jgi:ABC-2 type transport system permease protein
MQLVSRFLPPSYVFEGMRAVVAGGQVDLAALATGGALAVLAVVLSGWLFVRTHRHCVRSGLLARYSAENVS